MVVGSNAQIEFAGVAHGAVAPAPGGMAREPDGTARAAGAPPPLRESLRQLMILRSVAIGGQTAVIAAAWRLGVMLPVASMARVVGALAVLNVLTWLRLRSPRGAGHVEIASQLALDLAALSLLLYYSGGVANPFSLLLVLHVVLMALLLPPPAAAAGTALVLACFVTLARVHAPLAMTTGDALSPDLVNLGQGTSFVLTAAVVAWFVVRIVATLREHDRMLSDAAQRALSDDAVLRVGALAAGAAHELSTPLTTMAVVVGEMVRTADSPALRHDAGVLSAQIATCREAIANLMASAGRAHSIVGGRERLDRFLESIAGKCRTMRPDATIACDWEGIAPAPDIFAEQSLKQALLVLLNNAADASPDDVHFSGRRDGDMLRLVIADRGCGLPADQLGKLGRTFFTTKPPGKGAGLGLVIASRAIERLGGTLGWICRDGGGTQVDVVLPMRSLSLETEQ